MKFQSHQLYHVYNRGNNQQPIFYEQRNYFFFLKKMRDHLCPEATILAYCLMPNHFHWLLLVHDHLSFPAGNHPLNQQIGTLLSSYAKAMNNRYERTGSLFQQKTKSVHMDSQMQALTCFRYIHQNPLNAGLVQNLREWPYSSYPDYAGVRKGTLPSKRVALNMLDINAGAIIEESLNAIDPQKIKRLFQED